MSASDKLLTFDEFRDSHGDALREQRENLRDDAAAEAVLREGARAKGWVVWQENAIATES